MSLFAKRALNVSLTAAALGFSLAGCSVTANSPADPFPNSGLGWTTLNIDGVWSTGCLTQNGAAVQETLVLSQGSFSSTADVFMNTTCQGTPFMKESSSGTFLVGGPVQTPAGAYELDLTVTGGDSTQQGNWYTIVLVEGGSLYLSNTRTSQSSVRPTDVDRQRPYKKIGG